MKSEIRTDDLIRKLSIAAKSDAKRDASSRLEWPAYAKTWLTGAALILVLAFSLLPEREDLHERLAYPSTYFVILFWFLAALLPALKVYSLAFPDGRIADPIRQVTKYAALPLILLAVWSVVEMRYDDFAFQLFRESSHLNGGCGLVILVAGTLHAGFLFSWIRKGATTAPYRAGAWAAVSTASFASFIVQFACANENSIHVLMWHFLPLMLLTGVSALSAKRLLRW
jgi:hypothetical protein